MRAQVTARHVPVEGEELLVARWRPFAFWIARDYFLPGGSTDDVRQEALIGLLTGLRSFDPERGALQSFLHLAISRWLQQEVKTANRLKHRPLNDAVGTVALEDGEVEMFDMAPSLVASVEEQFEQREWVRAIVAAARTLTEVERDGLALVVNGGEYAHLPKRVDNAIARARQKLRAAA
jgi:RNA polymerase sporulation-specific sigma factor